MYEQWSLITCLPQGIHEWRPDKSHEKTIVHAHAKDKQHDLVPTVTKIWNIDPQ